MSKNIKTGNKTTENPTNNQQKLADVENSAQVGGSNINQMHNTKKQSLGPNTKR